MRKPDLERLSPFLTLQLLWKLFEGGNLRRDLILLMTFYLCFFELGLDLTSTFAGFGDMLGLGGNEQVDSSLRREVDVHISWGRVELREIIKEGLMKEWQTGWEKESRGRQDCM